MMGRSPEHLEPATAAWWRSVVDAFELDEHHERLLTLAAQAWDRTQQARELIAREGLTYTDRFDAPRLRPEVTVERDSRLAFARLLRELGLQDEPPPDPKPARRRS